MGCKYEVGVCANIKVIASSFFLWFMHVRNSIENNSVTSWKYSMWENYNLRLFFEN